MIFRSHGLIYYYICIDIDLRIVRTKDTTNFNDIERHRSNNYFLTEKEAIFKLNKIKKIMGEK